MKSQSNARAIRDAPYQAESSSSRNTIAFSAHPAIPRQVLLTDSAVAQWQTTPGFRAFWSWTTRRCDRIKGKMVIRDGDPTSSEGIRSLMDMLDRMSEWVSEVPPQPQSNQRFGNLAFREYIRLVEERLPDIVDSWPGMTGTLSQQILPLLINSHAFGHATRLDYGTGHELAFLLALWCCVIAGLIGGEGKEDEEDELMLRVFTRYLDLVTQLQKTYKLEPAGSHGVWGLDDYCFFPYLFGSAQLLDSDITPTQALRNAQNPKYTPTDLYTLSLRHITLFKTGASWSEHSPLLYQLSSFPDWKKPHTGLRKMFIGEVVGKRVVVQGLWIGGWLWGDNLPSGKAEIEGVRDMRMDGGTKAPWKMGGDGRQRALDAVRDTWSAAAWPGR